MYTKNTFSGRIKDKIWFLRTLKDGISLKWVITLFQEEVASGKKLLVYLKDLHFNSWKVLLLPYLYNGLRSRVSLFLSYCHAYRRTPFFDFSKCKYCVDYLYVQMSKVTTKDYMHVAQIEPPPDNTRCRSGRATPSKKDACDWNLGERSLALHQYEHSMSPTLPPPVPTT